ncbi:MAG: hypothetical protein WBP12_03220 [Candidatus Saccharimonas sp.]
MMPHHRGVTTRREAHMALFYGVELNEECSRPMDISEIMSLPAHVQEWVLQQLTRWVCENGGNRRSLLDDTRSEWARAVINQEWNAKRASTREDPKAELERTGRRVRVTSAQVMAARTTIRRLREKGEPIPLKMERIANARRSDGSPVLFGKPDLDEGYVTAEEAATLKPCVDPNIFELADTIVGMHLAIAAITRTST